MERLARDCADKQCREELDRTRARQQLLLERAMQADEVAKLTDVNVYNMLETLVEQNAALQKDISALHKARRVSWALDMIRMSLCRPGQELDSKSSAGIEVGRGVRSQAQAKARARFRI